MTAKEMFEELGFRLTQNQTPIQKKFYKKNAKGKQLVEHLIFNYFSKENYFEIEHYSIRKEPNRIEYCHIDTYLFKAIQKQIEELGWNNE